MPTSERSGRLAAGEAGVGAAPADSETSTSERQETAAPRRKFRLALPRWLRIAMSGVLLALLLSYVDVGQSWEIVRSARLDLLMFAVVLVVADRFLAAYRWYLLLHGRNPEASFWKVTRVYFVANFLGVFMPGSVGVEVLRVYGLARATADLALSFASALVERVLALLALFLLVLVGLIFSPPGLPPAIGDAAWLGLALLGIGVVVLMHPQLRRLTDAVLRGVRLASVRRGLAKLYACLDAYKDRPRLMAWAMFLALGFQLLRVFVMVVIAWSLGLNVAIIHFVVLMPIITFVVLLPISIGGIGVREASFVTLFGLVGVSPEAAFTLSVLGFTLATIVAALPGAWLYARGGLSASAR